MLAAQFRTSRLSKKIATVYHRQQGFSPYWTLLYDIEAQYTKLETQTLIWVTNLKGYNMS